MEKIRRKKGRGWLTPPCKYREEKRRHNTKSHTILFDFLPESKAAIHINAIEPQARPFVETYRSGKHIAYHRSIEMNVSVSTETVTETV